MRAELVEILRADFPDFYRLLGDTSSDAPIGHGLSVDSGWFDLLYELSSQITAYAGARGFEPVAWQVREKYGQLRVQVLNSDANIQRLLRDAEVRSAKICEVCGLPGQLGRSSGYWCTRCCNCAPAKWMVIPLE